MIPIYERPEFIDPVINITTVTTPSEPPLKCTRIRESKAGQAIRKKAIMAINDLKVHQRVEFEGFDVTLTRVRSYVTAADAYRSRLKSFDGRRSYTVCEITPDLIIVWRLA